MFCLERVEIDMLLARHGFGKVAWFVAYDPDVSIGSTNWLAFLE